LLRITERALQIVIFPSLSISYLLKTGKKSVRQSLSAALHLCHIFQNKKHFTNMKEFHTIR
jgi:hypothetical protein